jgi:hypothetical protein
MKTTTVQDRYAITSRTVTPEGYLVAPGVLARTGVQEYRAYELGLHTEGINPLKVIRLHRPAEEVFDPESMRSFESKPVTIEHPIEQVTAENWRELGVGEVRDVVRDGERMAAVVILKDKAAIEALQSGKHELSNGYSFSLDMTPGTTADGRPYDGVQRNIRGNHVALVDAARCGSACRIADSQPEDPKGITMPEATRKVVIDGITLEVGDTAASAIESLTKQRDDARTELATLQPKAAEAAGLKVALDKANADIEALKKDVMTPEARDSMVADWTKLIGDAKRLVPEIVTDGKTCVAIRREVVGNLIGKDGTAKAVAEAVLAGKTLEAADADTLRAAFNVLAASISTTVDDAESRANDAALAAALTKGEGQGNANKGPVLTGRDAFMHRQSQAWQTNANR